MYASRYADGPRFRPASLGAALAINGAVVGALLLAAPELIPKDDPVPLTIESIPLPTPDPLPSPEPAKPRVAARTAQRPDSTSAPDLPASTDPWPVAQLPYTPDAGPGPAATGEPARSAEPLAPAFVAAGIDPRYAADFQPDYPDTARDAGQEGIVQLRILIGIDGRVRQVQRVAGADVFWRAASRHALARWRFTPATRGGVPEESWRVMSVRFRLN